MNRSKRRIICLEIIFLCYLPVCNFFSQGQIYEVYPNLPRVDYFGVHFINPDTGFAVGEQGVILKTVDGGTNWVQKASPVNTTLNKINAFFYNNIFICGLNGTLLRSTDTGETWNSVNLATGNHLLALKIIDQQTGWLCGFDSVLYKTEDGGNTWISKTTGYPGNYRDIDFYDSNIGYICSTGGFLVTEDGGRSWESKIFGGFNTVEPVTDSIVIAGGPTAEIYYSDNRGTTWTIANDPFTSNIQSIELLNDTLGYATSFSVGHYFTSDGGQTWDWGLERIGNYQITFINENIGYGAGRDLTLTKTTDSGNIWKRLIVNQGITAVYFLNEVKGFLIANLSSAFEDRGQIYNTNDGGYRWEAVERFENFNNHINRTIAFSDSLNGFIGATGGIIFKTTNAGANWDLSDTTLVIIGIECAPVVDFNFYNDYGWALISAFIDGSRLKKTTNLGDDWTLLPIEFTNSLNNIFFLDEMNGWVTGQSYFGRTTDGGNSWIQDTSLNYNSYIDVFFSDLNTGWLTIDSNRTLNTTDGGLTWVITDLKGGNFLIVDNDNIYLTSDKALHYSSNRGISWSLRLDSTNALELSTMPKVNNGWGVNPSQKIYKYEDSVYVPVELTSFWGRAEGNKIILNWQTASELNNQGFDIEKSFNKKTWFNIGFVEGNGTTTEINSYIFIDTVFQTDIQYYRLKQLDFDGTFEYSQEIELNFSIPKEFSLSQNFPNPFNPSTTIQYKIPEAVIVNISIFDITGRKVKELVNEKKQPGYYNIELKGGELSSGIYFYRMVTSSGHKSVKKLVLIK